jgi:NAD(P)-dependent dehydrogenase (short-subunit alcohol dehydrogenase family)
MNFNVENKVILFTGCTGVLGKAMAIYLAQQNAILLLVGRNENKLKSLLFEVKKYNSKSNYYIADVSNEDDLIAIRNKIIVDFKGIDVLINAAGGNLPGATILPHQNFNETATSDLKKILDLNYIGTFLPCKTFVDILNINASIINISSMAANKPLTRVLGYASAKAAVDNFTKWLAVELAQKNANKIRVNAIAPGFFLTEQNRTLLTHPDGSLTDRGQKIIEHTPFNKFGTPEDLFGVLHWLCSDASLFVTGTIVTVDGGFSAFSGV